MEPGVRISIVGDEAERVEALVRACGLESPIVERVAAEGALARGADVLLAVCSRPSPEVATLLEAAGAGGGACGTVVVADAIDERLATLANRVGARVWASTHGAEALRAAIVRAASDGAERRERVRLERELRARETVRILVGLSVADVIFHLDVEGDRFRFRDVNPAFTKATGLAPEQVVGKLVHEVIPEPSLSLVLGKYREAVAEGRTVRWIETTEYPTGMKYGEVSVTPVLDGEGRCTSLIGTVHDVTERHERGEIIRRYADIVRAVDIALTVWSVDERDGGGVPKLVASNPAADRMSAVELSAGTTLLEAFPKATADGIAELVASVRRDGAVHAFPEHRLEVGGEVRIVAAKAFPLPGGVGLAVEDVSAVARARALYAEEHRILEMVASGASLAETLASLATAIEAQAPSAIASVLLVAPDGKHVVVGAAPHASDAWRLAIEGQPIGASSGVCGMAIALRRPVVVSDVANDARIEQPTWARELGVRAWWSTPIVAGDARVLGTFALHYRAPRVPSPAEVELLARAAHVAGIAVQRHELDAQLRALSARIEAAREEERTGIAREIHDQLGQSLTALKLDLAWISRRAKSADGLSKDALLDKVREISEMTSQTIDQVRRISAELRPGVLDDVGLSAALSWAAHEFEQRTRIACVVRADVPDEALGRELATTIFRVFQEALTNVVRHANATRVEVELSQRSGWLELCVRDDGKGIEPAEAQDPRSLGLLGIRERARRLGGVAYFQRAEPAGTLVTLRLPVAPSPSARVSSAPPS